MARNIKTWVQRAIASLPHLKTFRSVLGIGISALLLWLMISHSGLSWQNLRLSTSGTYYFAAAIGVFIATIWVQSLRIKLLWRPRTGLDTYRGLLAGNFYNCILPGNLGEGVRAMHLSRKNNIPILNSLASQIIEKYIDALSFIILCVLWYICYGYTPHYVNTVIIILCVLCGVIFLTGILFVKYPPVAKKATKYIPAPALIVKVIYKTYLHVSNRLRHMHHHKMLLPYFLFGFTQFFLNMLQYYLVMKAINLPPHITTFQNSYYLALCMVIIAFVPAAPGNTGVIHYGLYTALILLSMATPPSSHTLQLFASYTFFHHLSIMMPELIIGGFVIIKERKYLF
jgi:uncharacterized protein (TIRG00374 family)